MEIDSTDLAQVLSKQTGYSEAYSEKSFWEKVSTLPRSVITEGLEKALLLREVLLSRDSPMWARASILTCLGYLILPFDLVPDFMPGVGYLDDLAMMGLVIANVDTMITDSMRQRVNLKLGSLGDTKEFESRQEDEDETTEEPH